MPPQVRYEIYGSWNTPSDLNTIEFLNKIKAEKPKLEKKLNHIFPADFEDVEAHASLFRFRFPVVVAIDGHEKAHLQFLLDLLMCVLTDIKCLGGTIMAIDDEAEKVLGDLHGFNLCPICQ